MLIAICVSSVNKCQIFKFFAHLLIGLVLLLLVLSCISFLLTLMVSLLFFFSFYLRITWGCFCRLHPHVCVHFPQRSCIFLGFPFPLRTGDSCLSPSCCVTPRRSLLSLGLSVCRFEWGGPWRAGLGPSHLLLPPHLWVSILRRPSLSSGRLRGLGLASIGIKEVGARQLCSCRLLETLTESHLSDGLCVCLHWTQPRTPQRLAREHCFSVGSPVS